MEIPTYNITLEDWNEGIFAISIVDKPATLSNFIYMSEDKPKELFAFSDEEKGELMGAVLIPDFAIPRVDGAGNQFFVVFSKEVIEEINERMQETGGNKVFTIQHEMSVQGSIKFLESWIKETDEDKSTAFGLDVPIGTLLAKVKVESDFIKKNIKSGNLNGFSVELDSSMIKTNFNKLETKTSMDYKEVYPNSVTVEGVDLLFSDEKLDKGSVLFSVVEEKLTAYTGDFRIDNINYSAKNGLVVDVENIELSIQEKINTLTATVAALTAELAKEPEVVEGEATVAEQLTSIMTKLAEQELILEQKKIEPVKTEKVINEFSATDYKSASDWIKKWY